MNLKKHTFSAGRWTAGSALTRTGLQILQTSVLARILVPADFGLMAVTASLIAVLGLFSDLGLSRASIHFDVLSEDILSSLFWLNLGAGIALSLLFAASAPLMGSMFDIHGLTPVLLAVSPVFALSAVGQQFCALAAKELRFYALATNEVASSALGAVAAVWCALTGGGVYALVLGALVTSATGSTLAWARLARSHRPSLHFRLTEARPFLRFGGYLIAEGVVSTLIRQSDIFIAGLRLNSANLGLFAVPRNMSMRIGMIVNPIVTRVGFPVMARLRGDSAALKSVYLQTLRMTASVNFPAYFALALFADEVVALLYGPHWRGAGVYLRVLALWGLVRSTGNPSGSLLYAVGAVRRAFVWNLVCLLVLSFFYWIAVRGWGLPGLAAGLLVAQTALVLPSWYFLIRPCCGATAAEYLHQLATPLLLAAAAGVAAWLTTRGIAHGTLRLAVGGAVGGLTYLALSSLFNRQWFDAMWLLLRLPAPRRS